MHVLLRLAVLRLWVAADRYPIKRRQKVESYFTSAVVFLQKGGGPIFTKLNYGTTILHRSPRTCSNFKRAVLRSQEINCGN